jgi:hypothetical protein
MDAERSIEAYRVFNFFWNWIDPSSLHSSLGAKSSRTSTLALQLIVGLRMASVVERIDLLHS